MDLAPEDLLRLDILLANRPLADRVEESTLSHGGPVEPSEARVVLHPPPGHPEPGLERVRECLFS